jgi:putative DNA primase/helicase
MKLASLFEGAQGAGKSTAVQILGGMWAADSPIAFWSKDRFEVLRGKWILEGARLPGTHGA